MDRAAFTATSITPPSPPPPVIRLINIVGKHAACGACGDQQGRGGTRWDETDEMTRYVRPQPHSHSWAARRSPGPQVKGEGEGACVGVKVVFHIPREVPLRWGMASPARTEPSSVHVRTDPLASPY